MGTSRLSEAIQISLLAACKHEGRIRIGSLLLLGVAIVGWVGLGELPVLAQGAKKKAAAKPEQPELPDQPQQMELPSLSFDVNSLAEVDVYTPDPDETPEGMARVEVVANRARELYREYDAIDKDRRPLAIQRDLLWGEMLQLARGVGNANIVSQQASAQIFTLQQQIAVSNDNSLKAELARCQQAVANASAAAQNCLAQINVRRPKLDALNIAIKPLDNRLQKLWAELNACRKQWLELRVPHDKYARSDFEQLKFVIDDWLRVDGLWPDAFCWGAICSYELGDYEKAGEMVDKADDIRTKVLGSAKAWSQIEALQGLVAYQIPGQRRKSVVSIDKAMGHFDKDKDWVTPFVAGRAACEHDRMESKAKAYFERALKIKPNCACAKFHLALLQTTATDKNVIDVATGTKSLETLWSRMGKRSWRMSMALAEAYQAADRHVDAKRQWETTFALAPAREHERLISRRGQ